MTTRKTVLTCLAVAAATLMAPSMAAAHTETDLVAVPAGSEATVTLQPTHGCGNSPTIEVSIQAPVSGASGGDVDGWSIDVTEDDEGKTVVTWSGGSLPSDQTGAFPVTFTAPDTPGELLVFPAIQLCENGEELAWINGDPTSDYPAPRVLVLSSDGVPASSIDDVPADAPGRDQLTEIIDIDGPGGEDTGDPAPEEPAEDPQDETGDEAVDEPVAPEETTQTTVAPDDDGQAAPSDDDSSLTPILIALVVVGVILGIVASVLAKRRSDTDDLDDGQRPDDVPN